MKMLSNLRWCGFVVLLVIGMSSCLKKDDSLNIYVQYNYILQNNNGTFTPQLRLLSNELQSASINVAGKNFAFTSLNGFAWELTNSIYAPLGELDSVPAGYYTLTATGVNGKSNNLTIAFLEAKKKMSDVNVSEMEWLESEKSVKITLADSVQNASAYYLMIKVPSGSNTTNTFAMWTPYSQLTLTGDTRKLSATVPVPDLGKEKYRFAVGAVYGSTIRISNFYITVDNTALSE